MEIEVKISRRFHEKFISFCLEDEANEKEIGREEAIDIYVPLTQEERFRKENVVMKSVQRGVEDSRIEFLENEIKSVSKLFGFEIIDEDFYNFEEEEDLNISSEPTSSYIESEEYKNLIKCFHEQKNNNPHQTCYEQKKQFFELTQKNFRDITEESAKEKSDSASSVPERESPTSNEEEERETDGDF